MISSISVTRYRRYSAPAPRTARTIARFVTGDLSRNDRHSSTSERLGAGLALEVVRDLRDVRPVADPDELAAFESG